VNAGVIRALCIALCAATSATWTEAQPSDGSVSGAYEDRLIDGGNLAEDVSLGNVTQSAGGWSRSLRAEAITSRITRGDVDQDESGLRLSSMLDTANFGAITIDANLRTSTGYAYGSDTGSMISVFQMSMPMNGGWRVNNSLGVASAPSVDLARYQQRFWVPAILSNGLSTEWRVADGLQLHASVGRPGLFTGVYVPTFEELGGEQLGAGVEWNGPGGWSTAVQAVKVDDVPFGLGPLYGSTIVSGHSLLGAVAWRTPEARVQLSVVSSAANQRSDRLGTWVDTAIGNRRVRHTLGAFSFDPEMLWGNQPLPSNHQGGYYRAAFQSRRLIVDGGLDYVEPVLGDTDPTTFGTGYIRYQLSSRVGMGGGLNVRRDDTDAQSMFGFIDEANRLGITRMQANHATDDLETRTELTLSHTWNMPAGMRLGNSLIVGQDTYADDETRLLGIAVNGGGDLRGNLSADINARWDSAGGRDQFDSVLVNFALNWMFARGWSLGATYYVSRNNGRVPLDVTSPIDDLPIFQELRTDDVGYFVTVRRQWQAGSRSAPLAGVPRAGSGSIAGFLFLDDNDNGRMDAGETGAPNVVILLNSRFAARTNAEGRFEFPSVAAGTHVLSVVPDNLPLPWEVPQNATTGVTVKVRERAFVAIGAQKQR
jgi:hypothetical protein